MHLHLHVPTTLVLLALGVGESKGDSLYDLARRDCPVGSPGIPQYLRCVTECRVAVAAGGGEDEDAQRRCVGEKCCELVSLFFSFLSFLSFLASCLSLPFFLSFFYSEFGGEGRGDVLG
ncbi:hypothetical protein F5X96DRAFT_636416 [Biscogniauxia mediterranea]|nr:hypothetical protein F5X96DRAFT_636416 [Biscogniauxia mediterranea]